MKMTNIEKEEKSHMIKYEEIIKNQNLHVKECKTYLPFNSIPF
jgi:hypothetical protein